MKVATLQGAELTVATLQGAELTVTIEGSTVKVGGATVTTADLECSNGVIHVIDTVLLPPAGGNNIVETAVSDGNFKTLTAALTKAQLVDTLSGGGPFTVFAPTDAAFTAALTALGLTAEELLAKPDLGDILKFHVVSGKVMSSGLSNGMKVATLQGAELTVTIEGSTVKVGGATVTTADLECSNGVIHVIDTVLLPPAGGNNIVETAVANGNFKTLAAALTKAQLVDTLSGEGPFTVFAPTDAAFTAALTALGLTA